MLDNKIVVGIDMDGTSAQLLPTWIKKINEYYHVNLSMSDIDDSIGEDIIEWCKNKFGLSKAEIKKPFNEVGFWTSLEPMEHAVEVIKKIIADEIYLPIIVTRPSWQADRCVIEKFNWVVKHLGDQIPFVATEHKYLVSCMDYMIDDHKHNLLDCMKYGIKTIKFNQPWNKNVSATYSVNNWKQIEDLLL